MNLWNFRKRKKKRKANKVFHIANTHMDFSAHIQTWRDDHKATGSYPTQCSTESISVFTTHMWIWCKSNTWEEGKQEQKDCFVISEYDIRPIHFHKEKGDKAWRIAWLPKGHGELLRISLFQVLCFCPVKCKVTFILLVLLTVLGTWTVSILPVTIMVI